MSLPRSALLVVIALALAACSKGNGPAEELKSLFEMLGNPNISPSRLSDMVYTSLDDASRAAVDARAKALGERLGTKIDPDEILQVRGLSSGLRVAKVEAINREEERATLEVSFAPITFTGSAVAAPSAPAAPTTAPTAPAATTPMRVEVIKQSGKWRIAFLELAKFIGSRPIDAASAGGAR